MDNQEFCERACWLCGRNGNGKKSVHRDAKTMHDLHQWGQQKAMEENGWDIDDFRREFGKNYI